MIVWLRRHVSEPLSCGERIGVGVEGAVVRRETLAQLVELDEGCLALARQHREILAAAQEEAAALIAQAAGDAQALHEAAQRECDTAHERGYEAGRRDALADWYGRTARQLAQRHAMQRSLSSRIAELVVGAVEKIVTTESPAALFARATEAVERIVDGGSYLRVHVHPDEHEAAALAFEGAAERWHELGRAVALTVSADSSLEPGACLCETDIGSVDASLRVQLDAVRTAVERAVRRAGRAEREGRRGDDGDDGDARDPVAGTDGEPPSAVPDGIEADEARLGNDADDVPDDDDDDTNADDADSDGAPDWNVLETHG
ncbi:type III secretion system stator protein SctL [Trinickia dinghuensis]|uniref:Flagellar assembly protein FliH n=1 Tax=Trinickia dinghuensis TaxID=2291023 RepID=A0A3D8JUJ9_9BURK|nr:type III secretion system stator protein SctL [Trinickia dinghuensis]RDU96748.1 HrpE/YscL family type III secretion apparatus protein [Trinickia dinghuensis]